MSIVTTQKDLLPVRRDKQIPLSGAGSVSGGGINGRGSTPITAHSLLSQLDYTSSDHIGFAPIDSPEFTTEINVTGNAYLSGMVIAGGLSAIDSVAQFQGKIDTTLDYQYLINFKDEADTIKFNVSNGLAAGGWFPVFTGKVTSEYPGLYFVGNCVNGPGAGAGIIGFDARRNNGAASATDIAFAFKSGYGTVLAGILGNGTIYTAGGIHVGGTSDPGTDNLLVDGTCEITGISTFTGLIKTAGGVHIGGTSDPGADNLIVDGTSLLTGVATFSNDLGTAVFTSGFVGSGWKLDYNTDYSLTVDNLTVRKMMRVYELEINKINSVNGGIMVSVANGKAYSINPSLNIYDRYTATDGNPPTDYGWVRFVTNGLDITDAKGSAAQSDFAQMRWNPTDPSYQVASGGTITITGTVTCSAGEPPAIRWYFNNVEVDYDLLVVGANSISYTAPSDGTVKIGISSGLYNAYSSEWTFTSVTVTCDDYKIVFDEDESTAGTGNIIQFAANDYIRAQEWTGRGVDYYLGKVIGVHHSSTLGYAFISVTNVSGTPWAGADLVQVGNTSTASRQNMIYITAADDNNPYIQMVTGVTDGDFTGHTKVMLGNLEGIAGYDIVPASPGYGLYSQNVYLSGKIVATSGTVGGFTVNSTDGLYSGSGATRVQMKAGAGFWAGATAIGDAPFSVTEAGVLKAIGNCTIGSATGNVDLGTTGSRGSVDAYSKLRFYGAKQNWSYSVQDNTTLTTIAYSCYRLDTADVAKTLTLPTDANMNSYLDATIILVNPTKANFTIDTNSINAYLNTASPVTSFILGEGDSCTLIYIDHGTNPGWYRI